MNRQPTPSILDDVLTTDASHSAPIRNDGIKIDGGTQMRAQLDAATVAEYADAMTDGGWGQFPPVIAYYDGSDYWLADGFHRLAAFRSIANYSDAMIPADVRSGTRRDAILHAAGANASHGLRRTNADKRRSVETLLRDEEWAKWSNMEIARRCNVSEGTVRNIRGDMERTSQITKSDERHGADGRTTNTANIGANRPPRRHIYENELERIVVAWAAEHYPADWPENPSHTNGTYWQQLTAHLRATITAAAWHESDLKVIIKRLHVQRLSRAAISNQQSPINNLPPKEETADPSRTLDRFVRQDALDNAPDPAPRPSPLAPSPYKSLAQMDADGEIPPLGPPSPSSASAIYASVHPIQTALRSLLATYTAADLRTTANYRGGSRWFEARRLLAAAEIHYRDRDLVQALNNLADELEQSQPAQPSTASTDALFDYQIDDALAELVQQANASLDGQIHSVFPGSATYWAEQVSQALQKPVTYQRMALAMERLMRSLQEQRSQQPGFVPLKMAQPSTPSTPSISSTEPDDRIPRCLRLIGIYHQAIGVEDEYGALTGCYSETTAPKRELQKLIARLQRTIDLLEGNAVDAEECD